MVNIYDRHGHIFSVQSSAILYMFAVMTVRKTVDRAVKTVTVQSLPYGHKINDNYDRAAILTARKTSS